MSDWVPATEWEAAMLGALSVSDQEHYFRILTRTNLLLPVSPDEMAGRAPMGWGTWTSGNRTHVLAFTSPSAMASCFADQASGHRAVPFVDLAAAWPNFEWWLAVNPGLPIEAYLPSWFVAQLARGDVRLPGRTLASRARANQSDLASAVHGRSRASGPGTATARVLGAVEEMDLDASGHVVETVDAELVDAPAEPLPPPDTFAGTAPDAFPGAFPGAFSGAFADTSAGTATGSHAGTTAGSNGGAASVGAGDAVVPAPRRSEDAEIVPPGASGRPAGSGFGSQRFAGQTFGASSFAAAGLAAAGFVPANETEANLLAAAEQSNTDSFLSTLLLARVIVPVPPATPATARPRDRDFPWQVEDRDAEPYISVFTSPQRLNDRGAYRFGPGATSVSLRFVELIAAWPDEKIAFAINPGTPVGATLPGSQIVALAAWATEVGLRDGPSAEVAIAPKPKRPVTTSTVGVAGAPAAGASQATVMQRVVAAGQVAFYLERGYDRVSGFVNRASEVAHLSTPRSLYRALGLIYPGSPFAEDDAEVYVLRWVAHRSGLYRIPYGGPHEAAMRAMQGWVIEKSPFRGNGFAPGDSDVIAEFKVDSIRLPHGAQMWRIDKVSTQALVATFDADETRWVPAAGLHGGRHA